MIRTPSNPRRRNSRKRVSRRRHNSRKRVSRKRVSRKRVSRRRKSKSLVGGSGGEDYKMLRRETRENMMRHDAPWRGTLAQLSAPQALQQMLDDLSILRDEMVTDLKAEWLGQARAGGIGGDFTAWLEAWKHELECMEWKIDPLHTALDAMIAGSGTANWRSPGHKAQQRLMQDMGKLIAPGDERRGGGILGARNTTGAGPLRFLVDYLYAEIRTQKHMLQVFKKLLGEQTLWSDVARKIVRSWKGEFLNEIKPIQRDAEKALMRIYMESADPAAPPREVRIKLEGGGEGELFLFKQHLRGMAMNEVLQFSPIIFMRDFRMGEEDFTKGEQIFKINDIAVWSTQGLGDVVSWQGEKGALRAGDLVTLGVTQSRPGFRQENWLPWTLDGAIGADPDRPTQHFPILKTVIGSNFGFTFGTGEGVVGEGARPTIKASSDLEGGLRGSLSATLPGQEIYAVDTEDPDEDGRFTRVFTPTVKDVHEQMDKLEVGRVAVFLIGKAVDAVGERALAAAAAAAAPPASQPARAPAPAPAPTLGQATGFQQMREPDEQQMQQQMQHMQQQMQQQMQQIQQQMMMLQQPHMGGMMGQPQPHMGGMGGPHHQPTGGMGGMAPMGGMEPMGGMAQQPMGGMGGMAPMGGMQPQQQEEEQQQLAVALWDYVSRAEGDLSMNEGDVVVVTDASGDWWRGYLQKAPSTSGVFPSNYVEVMSRLPTPKSGRFQMLPDRVQDAVQGLVQDAEQPARTGAASGPTQPTTSSGQLTVSANPATAARRVTPVVARIAARALAKREPEPARRDEQLSRTTTPQHYEQHHGPPGYGQHQAAYGQPHHEQAMGDVDLRLSPRLSLEPASPGSK